MKKVFKLLFGWLGNRYLLAVLGLISLCLVIWFIGPLIAVAGWAPLGPEPVRWIAMIVAAFTVGLVSVGSALRQRRANAAVVAELATDCEDGTLLCHSPASNSVIPGS